MTDAKQLAVESTRLAQLDRAFAAQDQFAEAFARLEATLSMTKEQMDALGKRLELLGSPPTQ